MSSLPLGYSRSAGVESASRSTVESAAEVLELELPRIRNEPFPVNAPFLKKTPVSGWSSRHRCPENKQAPSCMSERWIPYSSD